MLVQRLHRMFWVVTNYNNLLGLCHGGGETQLCVSLYFVSNQRLR